MDTPRDLTTGYHAWQPTAPRTGSHADVGRLLAHLEQRLAELGRLHREMPEDAHALAQFAAVTPEGRDVAGGRSVYSIRAAATELGVSVSMLHKLLKQRCLGHLKVGARTLITAERRGADWNGSVFTGDRRPRLGVAQARLIAGRHQPPLTNWGCRCGHTPRDDR